MISLDGARVGPSANHDDPVRLRVAGRRARGADGVAGDRVRATGRGAGPRGRCGAGRGDLQGLPGARPAAGRGAEGGRGVHGRPVAGPDDPARGGLHRHLVVRVGDRDLRGGAAAQGPRPRDRGAARGAGRGHRGHRADARLPAGHPAAAAAGLARGVRAAAEAGRAAGRGAGEVQGLRHPECVRGRVRAGLRRAAREPAVRRHAAARGVRAQWRRLGFAGSRSDEGGTVDVVTALDRLPKVELHCHVEGTMRPGTVVELASKNGIELPTSDPTELYRYSNLDTFLEIFWLVQSTLGSREDWARLAHESIVDGGAHGRGYRGAFSPPARHLDAGQDLADIVAGLAEGLEAAEAETGVRAMLIADIDRAYGGAAGLAMVQRLLELREAASPGVERVIGVGLDS